MRWNIRRGQHKELESNNDAGIVHRGLLFGRGRAKFVGELLCRGEEKTQCIWPSRVKIRLHDIASERDLALNDPGKFCPAHQHEMQLQYSNLN